MVLDLSLAIPTYNRAGSIAKRIVEYKHFNRSIKGLWISDNSTNDDTEALFNNENKSKILYQRNKYNIGGGANFIASVTMGNSDYVWLRGDDDPITKEQVEAVVDALLNKPDIIILSERSTVYRSISSVRGFFEAFDEAQSAGWLSMIVFKQSSLEYSLKWGYWGIKSGWANIALILGILRDKPDASCLLVPVQIGTRDFREDGRQSRKWSVLKTCIDDFPSIFDIMVSADDVRFAWYQWRKTQTFNLCRTFLRSRLGLCYGESLSLKTLANLASVYNPRSTLIGTVLLLINLMPRQVLACAFALIFKYTPREYMMRLELPEIVGLSIPKAYRFIRIKQQRQQKSQSFL
jgi:hypothetical protein